MHPVGPQALIRSVLAICIAAVSVLSCSSAPRVKTAYDPRAEFSRYRTFSLIHPNRPVPSSSGIDPFTLFRLRQMAHATLHKQGFTPVQFQQAQLLVSLNADTRTRTEVVPASYWTPYRRDYYYGSDVWTFNTLLIKIDILDAKTRAVIWHGSTENIYESDPPDEELWRMVQAILSHFPPGDLPAPQ